MSLRLVIDNVRLRPSRVARTDCFEDPDGRPLAGTPAPRACPFCGCGSDKLQLVCFGESGPGVEWRHSSARGCDCTYHVDCMGCGAEGPRGVTQLEAAQGWNRRAGEVPELIAGRVT